MAFEKDDGMKGSDRERLFLHLSMLKNYRIQINSLTQDVEDVVQKKTARQICRQKIH